MKKVFIAVCVIVALATCQKIYESHLLNEQSGGNTVPGPQTRLEKDLRENIIGVDKATTGYNTTTTPEQIEQEMQAVADGLVKVMVQGMLARAAKIHVPDPMLQNTNFLYSKEKLDGAIRKQEEDIKRYKKEINTVINDIMQGGTSDALASCEKAYTKTECEKIKKPFERGLADAKNKLYAAVPIYIDYIEEELNTMRFISNHYNGFTTSGQFPHFTDTALQKQFITKIQEVDKKGRAVAELRNNAWQDAHARAGKI